MQFIADANSSSDVFWRENLGMRCLSWNMIWAQLHIGRCKNCYNSIELGWADRLNSPCCPLGVVPELDFPQKQTQVFVFICFYSSEHISLFQKRVAINISAA